MGGTVLQFLGVYGGDGAGEVHLLLYAVTYHHRLFQHHGILLEGNRYRSLSGGDLKGLSRVAQARHFQGSVPCPYTDREMTIGVGDHGIGGAGDHDDGSDNGLSGRILDSAVNGPVLGLKLPKRSQGQDQANSNSFDLSHR